MNDNRNKTQVSAVRMGMMLLASAMLAVVGLGSSCPGTGSSANFENAQLVSLITGSTSSKSWRAPEILDIGGVDLSSACLNHDQTMKLTGLVVSGYPMSVFNDTAGDFYTVFNRADTNPTVACGGVAPSNVNAFVVQNSTAASGGTWAAGYSSFTQLDPGMGVNTDSLRPISAVDGQSNATVVFFTKTAALSRRAIGLRHTYNGGAWGAPATLSSTGDAGDILDSAAISVDAYNNTVVVWAQSSKAYFNEYRPNLGWRFSGSFSTLWNLTADGNVVDDLGVDIGFDGYGNGYALYSASPGAVQKISAARWRGNTALNLDPTTAGDYQTISTGAPTPYRWPRIAVAPNGAATAFFTQTTITALVLGLSPSSGRPPRRPLQRLRPRYLPVSRGLTPR